MNKTILIGRLTKDPELKRTPNNLAVVQFTVAVSRKYKSASGEYETDFINCVAWRAQAENLAKYMRRGSLIGIEGQIQTRNYEDNNGVRRYVTEVLAESISFLESKSTSSANTTNTGFSASKDKSPEDFMSKTNDDPFTNIKSDFDVSNDDLPF